MVCLSQSSPFEFRALGFRDKDFVKAGSALGAGYGHMFATEITGDFAISPLIFWKPFVTVGAFDVLHVWCLSAARKASPPAGSSVPRWDSVHTYGLYTR